MILIGRVTSIEKFGDNDFEGVMNCVKEINHSVVDIGEVLEGLLTMFFYTILKKCEKTLLAHLIRRQAKCFKFSIKLY
jgi:hypothetical protein